MTVAVVYADKAGAAAGGEEHIQPKRLFHRAIMDSGAHTARAIHPPSSALNTRHFRELLDLTPCREYTNLLDSKILDCLRDLPGETVDKAGKEVFERSGLFCVRCIDLDNFEGGEREEGSLRKGENGSQHVEGKHCAAIRLAG